MMNPKIRFKKSDGSDYQDWNKEVLKNVLAPANKDKVDTSLFKKITIGLHKKGISYATVRDDMADTRPFYRRYKGELMIGKQNYFNGSIAIVPEQYDGCICSNAIMNFIFHNVNGQFLYESISRDSYLQHHAHLAEGGGQKEVSETNFLKMTTNLPMDIEEQTKIANFLSEIDNLIASAEKEVESTKQLKKAMLQKMFPKRGEKVPEVRFPGFTDDWEQRKLSDIYASIGNAFVGTATPYYVSDGHFYLESNNVKDGQINHNTEIFINDEFYEKQKDKWLHTGDMVMVQSGHVGHAAVIPEELDNSAAHALIMFRNPKVKINPYFLNYQYQTIKAKKKIENITTGNTIKHILASDMQDFVVDVPNFDEQEKIGTYFRNLDNLITLHQRKCDTYKKFKKAMMQKMFV